MSFYCAHHNLSKSLALMIAGLAWLGVLGCERRPKVGLLHVKAADPAGNFEIYRIAHESPLQFVSEEVGKFNEDIPLAPGSYLVLADCSSETIIIYPEQRATLTAHRARFVPPHRPSDRDSFSIQCSRADKTKSRQLIAGRYDLNIIGTKQDLLVGMVPLQVDFSGTKQDASPDEIIYRLSALQVADFDGNRQELSYFISPLDERISATKYQQFGNWEFLLKGRYLVEVNGTRMQVDLAEGEERQIRPALLQVKTSAAVDLEQPAKIKGSPWLVAINGGHWLNFNETYPVLPGLATLAISGSSRSVAVSLSEGERKDLETRSITVQSGCDRSDLSSTVTCFGDRGVSLYAPDEPYPFMESVSDIPILFIDQATPVLVGVDGSRDILFEVPATVRDKNLALGYLRLNPIPTHRPSQITDLVRVDVASSPLTGHSLDINLEKPSVMPLIAGVYRLDHFVTVTVGDNSTRQNTSKQIQIEPGRTIEAEFPVYISEKKYAAYRKKHTQQPDLKAVEAQSTKATFKVRSI
ncbi:MAG: hypothetical protein FJ146_19210 [Deltaproteobacteria bacterium]|nr:hypothetical protein [Deltaproteobacteria bacterium]